jgi:hypothetical protein
VAGGNVRDSNGQIPAGVRGVSYHRTSWSAGGFIVFNNIILSVMAWTTNTVGYFVAKLKEERGQDILEYAILAGGIAILLGAAVFLIDPGVFTNFASEVQACIGFDPSCGSGGN